MAVPSINNLNNLNNLMHSVQYRNSLPTATKTPLLDRYHYSGHGGDWQSDWAGSGYGHSGHSSSYGGGHSKKSNIALSALTLLAFLFFLNILQNCIQDHLYDMNSANTTGVVVMTTAAARRRLNRFHRHKVGRRSVPNDIMLAETVLGNSELLESVKLFNATVGSSSIVQRFYDLLEQSLQRKYGVAHVGIVNDNDVTVGNDFNVVQVIEGALKGGVDPPTSAIETTIERNFVPKK